MAIATYRGTQLCAELVAENVGDGGSLTEQQSSGSVAAEAFVGRSGRPTRTSAVTARPPVVAAARQAATPLRPVPTKSVAKAA